jgi:hypothetical protein
MRENTHKEFLLRAQYDIRFMAFVEDVSPRNHAGKQPVFFEELFLVLKILWAIYEILKSRGWFSKWLAKKQVREAMKLETTIAKEAALLRIQENLVG